MILLFDEFKDDLIRQGIMPNVTGKTLKATMQFSQYMKSEDMKAVTGDDIDRYETCLRTEYITHEGRRLTERKILFKLRSLKTYFEFLAGKGYIRTSPASGLKIPTRGGFGRYCIPTREEVEELSSKPDEYTHSGIRDRALIRLIYACPITLEEYRDLNIEDVKIKDGCIHIKTANGRYDGKFPVDEKTLAALKKYIKVSRPALWNRRKVPTNKLFLNYYGEPFSKGTLFDIFDKYRGDKNINTTSLRQSRAMHMTQDGIDAKDIQALFGFKSINSARVYEVAVASGFKSIYRKFGPKIAVRFPESK